MHAHSTEVVVEPPFEEPARAPAPAPCLGRRVSIGRVACAPASVGITLERRNLCSANFIAHVSPSIRVPTAPAQPSAERPARPSFPAEASWAPASTPACDADAPTDGAPPCPQAPETTETPAPCQRPRLDVLKAAQHHAIDRHPDAAHSHPRISASESGRSIFSDFELGRLDEVAPCAPACPPPPRETPRSARCCGCCRRSC